MANTIWTYRWRMHIVWPDNNSRDSNGDLQRNAPATNDELRGALYAALTQDLPAGGQVVAFTSELIGTKTS